MRAPRNGKSFERKETKSESEKGGDLFITRFLMEALMFSCICFTPLKTEINNLFLLFVLSRVKKRNSSTPFRSQSSSFKAPGSNNQGKKRFLGFNLASRTFVVVCLCCLSLSDIAVEKPIGGLVGVRSHPVSISA